MTKVIIFWKAHGAWRCTAIPFDTLAEAQLHSKLHLEDNSISNAKTGELLTPNTNRHITCITFVDVELPE